MNDEEDAFLITELIEETEEGFLKSVSRKSRFKKDNQLLIDSLTKIPRRRRKSRTIINRWISIYWKQYGSWYDAFVRRKLNNGKYVVKYEDESVSIEEDLENEMWEFKSF
jgi:hypothetical protein